MYIKNKRLWIVLFLNFVSICLLTFNQPNARAADITGAISLEGGELVYGVLCYDNVEEQNITFSLSGSGTVDVYIVLLSKFEEDFFYYSVNMSSELVMTGKQYTPFYQRYEIKNGEPNELKIKIPLRGLDDGPYCWYLGISSPDTNQTVTSLASKSFSISSKNIMGISLSTDKTSYDNTQEQILKIDITGELRVDAYLYVILPNGAKYFVKADTTFGEANQKVAIKKNWLTQPGTYQIKFNLKSLPEGKYSWWAELAFPSQEETTSWPIPNVLRNGFCAFSIVSETDVKDAYDMVYIEGGSFMMGTLETQYPVYDEIPQHFVKLNAFYIGKYEVTNAQYLAYKMSLSAAEGENFANEIKGRENHPVSEVSWNDAVKYCQWLSQQTGQTYRLPTEAEWEFACRAGTTTSFFWGEEFVPAIQYGNYRAETNITVIGPVGLYTPNKWGLYDMVGNVNEWCSDWYSDTYYQVSPAENPKGPDTGQYRVCRGASYMDYGILLRSAVRIHQYLPDTRSPQTGFRIVREVAK